MSSKLAKRIVIKIGTSTLTKADGSLDLDYIDNLAGQVASLKLRGSQVLIVTSAAITAGLEELALFEDRPKNIEMLQAAAAVGQLKLAKAYSQAFEKHDICVGQILLTRFEIEDRQTYLHARDTINTLLELDVVPLINENDTVAVDEIRFGDNDTLAAQVAILAKADLVILLSDIEGLYTADPHVDEDAQLLKKIAAFTNEIVQAAQGSKDLRGSGGMATKIEAARILMAASIKMVICEGHVDNVIYDTALGQEIGTSFVHDEQKNHRKAKKLWTALSAVVRGTIYIDDGALHALRKLGSSLLPVGVKRVEGSFTAGQAVDIRGMDGFLIGRGICGYSSDELFLAAGKKSSELSDNSLFEHLGKVEVIHRDQLVVF